MKNILLGVIVVIVSAVVIGCVGNERTYGLESTDTLSVDSRGVIVKSDDSTAVEPILPFTGSDVKEWVVDDNGHNAVRVIPDSTISDSSLLHKRDNAFIVISKKDLYLYVYEPQGKDTVMIARYDVAIGLNKGNKVKSNDMCTPASTLDSAFTIVNIVDASTWVHDFGDGRGAIKSYGAWFLRLKTPPHTGIGIHGSTNNRESVPGRASEGCIRLRDEDIIDLNNNYAFPDMKVVIKDENIDDLPFEIRAFKNQKVKRARHFNPTKTLTNEQVHNAKPTTNNR